MIQLSSNLVAFIRPTLDKRRCDMQFLLMVPRGGGLRHWSEHPPLQVPTYLASLGPCTRRAFSLSIPAGYPLGCSSTKTVLPTIKLSIRKTLAPVDRLRKCLIRFENSRHPCPRWTTHMSALNYRSCPRWTVHNFRASALDYLALSPLDYIHIPQAQRGLASALDYTGTRKDLKRPRWTTCTWNFRDLGTAVRVGLHVLPLSVRVGLHGNRLCNEVGMLPSALDYTPRRPLDPVELHGGASIRPRWTTSDRQIWGERRLRPCWTTHFFSGVPRFSLCRRSLLSSVPVELHETVPVELHGRGSESEKRPRWTTCIDLDRPRWTTHRPR